jgi:hypothetical protein
VIGDHVEGPPNPPAGAPSSLIGRRAGRRPRVLALLLGSWLSAGLLVGGVGGPLTTAAGVLLALLFPGWLLAEMVAGDREAPLELWLMITLGASLIVTLILGPSVRHRESFRGTRSVGAGWLFVPSSVAPRFCRPVPTARRTPIGE